MNKIDEIVYEISEMLDELRKKINNEAEPKIMKYKKRFSDLIHLTEEISQQLEK